MSIKQFFEKIDFSFGSDKSDIKPVEITISENEKLTQKLKDNTYAFDSPHETNSSFYVVTIPLKDKDLFELRRYIWNEDKYDLYFFADKSKNDIEAILYYAKTDPRQGLKIASFRGRDTEKLEKIKKWKFDSGIFWAAYGAKISKAKDKNNIDKELIEQLRQLKNKLRLEISQEDPRCDEIVQALIDRTLFIKFLEDKHIINSFFYKHNFPEYSKNSRELGYKAFLKERDIDSINKLFGEINKIFNNVLFNNPSIERKYLTKNVLDFIYEAILQQNWKTGQMSLFDFRFDVIPIEFISHIYEVFLEKTQLESGIFYTPKKLAELIVDDTMIDTGTVLDPACGSGMFLVLALRKIFKNNPLKSNNISEKIEHRNKLLNDNIFGIEIKNIAWRLTIFSLYLEILKDISAEEIKEYIKVKLESDSKFTIFPYDFSSNIINCNALEIEEEKIPHKNKTFKYIVGNPPFFEIKNDDTEDSLINSAFINKYQTSIDGENFRAVDVIGHNQISQAFMLKIKDWASHETRLGFVLNSSNFYNDSKNFQNFFFEYYQIEAFYELSRVKDILFRKAGESVIVAIFNNRENAKNTMKYYSVHMEAFSKLFNLLVIKEDQVIRILQSDILDGNVNLRDYLIGNEYDLKLLNKLSENDKLNDYLLKDNRYTSLQGLTRNSNKVIAASLQIKESELKSKSKKDKYHREYDLKHYLNEIQNSDYPTRFIYDYSIIEEFKLKKVNGFINIDSVDKVNFQRARNKFIFEGENILFRRVGNKIKAVFCEYDKVFSVNIFGIKLKSKDFYYLVTVILNSYLMNYYINLRLKKRPVDNFPRIDKYGVENIPIPRNLDKNLVAEISHFSQQLTNGDLQYKREIKDKLNSLIFDLYDLNFLERQRINDFFSEAKNANDYDLEKYKESLYQTLEMYFDRKPVIKDYKNPAFGINIIVTAVYFNDSQEHSITGKKMFKHIIREIFEKENFLGMREYILGKDCIYIVKNNALKNWSISKGFEDGKKILKRLEE